MHTTARERGVSPFRHPRSLRHAPRRASARFVCLVLTLGATACGPRPGDVPAERAGDPPAGTAVADGPTDTRIVSLVPSLNELLVAMGARDRIVARTDFDTDPALTHLPSVGGGLDPSLEQLVALRVDHVLLPEGQGMPALASRLADLGIRAVEFRTETVEHLHESIERLGSLAGQPGSADSLSASLRERLDEVARSVAGRPPVPVMYVLWGDPPMTVASGTYVDEILTMAGGRNVFGDAPTAWPTVGFESVVARDPDVIVWPRGASSEVTLETLRGQPGWRDVRAVQEGRVEFVDTDLFNRPGPQLPEAARALVPLLHPDMTRHEGR